MRVSASTSLRGIKLSVEQLFVATEKQNSILYEGRFEKTQYIYIFLIQTSVFTSIAKKSIKSNLKSRLRCEFDAKMHLNAQNIEQF